MIFRHKLFEYNLISTLNSKTETFDERLMSKIDRERELYDNFNNILIEFDKIINRFPSLEHKIFLNTSWPQSLASLKEKIQNQCFLSIEDIKMNLAAFIFNFSISLQLDDENTRQELLKLFDIIMQL